MIDSDNVWGLSNESIHFFPIELCLIQASFVLNCRQYIANHFDFVWLLFSLVFVIACIAVNFIDYAMNMTPVFLQKRKKNVPLVLIYTYNK